MLDKGVLCTLRRDKGIAVALRRVVPLGGSRYVIRRFVLVHVVRKVEVVPILTGGLVCPRGVFPRCLVRRRVLGRRFGGIVGIECRVGLDLVGQVLFKDQRRHRQHVHQLDLRGGKALSELLLLDVLYHTAGLFAGFCPNPCVRKVKIRKTPPFPGLPDS